MTLSCGLHPVRAPAPLKQDPDIQQLTDISSQTNCSSMSTHCANGVLNQTAKLTRTIRAHELNGTKQAFKYLRHVVSA